MKSLSFQAICDTQKTIGDLKNLSESFSALPENRNIHYDPESETLLEIERMSAEQIILELKDEN